MSYNRRQVRPLLTDGEYELFSASLSDSIGGLDAKALSQAIARTRRARDKYRDLAQRQNISTGRRAGARAAAHTANERTQAKETVFGEALERLERHRAKREAAAQRQARAAALEKKAAKAAAGPNRAARRAAGKTPDARPSAVGAFISDQASASNQSAVRAPQTRIAASRGAATRRNQAKRDR